MEDDLSEAGVLRKGLSRKCPVLKDEWDGLSKEMWGECEWAMFLQHFLPFALVHYFFLFLSFLVNESSIVSFAGLLFHDISCRCGLRHNSKYLFFSP